MGNQTCFLLLSAFGRIAQGQKIEWKTGLGMLLLCSLATDNILRTLTKSLLLLQLTSIRSGEFYPFQEMISEGGLPCL